MLLGGGKEGVRVAGKGVWVMLFPQQKTHVFTKNTYNKRNLGDDLETGQSGVVGRGKPQHETRDVVVNIFNI